MMRPTVPLPSSLWPCACLPPGQMLPWRWFIPRKVLTGDTGAQLGLCFSLAPAPSLQHTSTNLPGVWGISTPSSWGRAFSR